MKITGILVVVALAFGAISAGPVEAVEVKGSIGQCGITAIISLTKCLTNGVQDFENEPSCDEGLSEERFNASIGECLMQVAKEFLSCIMSGEKKEPVLRQNVVQLLTKLNNKNE